MGPFCPVFPDDGEKGEGPLLPLGEGGRVFTSTQVSCPYSLLIPVLLMRGPMSRGEQMGTRTLVFLILTIDCLCWPMHSFVFHRTVPE